MTKTRPAGDRSITKTRPAAVAGSFYPAEAHELAATVEQLLAAAAASGSAPQALVAPHAGYSYSGPVAASAYARLAPARGRIQRVLLLGPSHRVPFWGTALTRADFYETPLGAVPVDRETQEEIARLPHVRVLEEAHRREHSLEVHLPFLQTILGPFRLVPMVVGEASADEVAEILDLLWEEPDTSVVVSSDLSHYHDYQTARAMDAETSEHIARLEWDAIDAEHACGVRPLAGLLRVARRRAMRVEVLDVRNSGDTSGGHDEVVGYGSYAFHSAVPGGRS